MKIVERIMKNSRTKDEKGAALISIIAVAAFTFIAIMALTSSSLFFTDLTYKSRSNILTLMSAESGLDSAVYATASGQCVAEVVSPEYNYSYNIYRSNSATTPTSLSDSSVFPGCPITGDTFFFVESTGTNINGDSTTILAVYGWMSRSPGITTESAVFDDSVDGLGTTSIVGSGGEGLLLIKDDFTCLTNTLSSGDVIVLDGDVTLGFGCVLGGNIYVGGDVLIRNNASVGGSVYALGSIEIDNDATIAGGVYSKSNVIIRNNATIGGNVVSEGVSNLNWNGGTIEGNAYVIGGATNVLNNGILIKGNFTSSSSGTLNLYDANVQGNINFGGDLWLQWSSVGGSVSGASSDSHTVAPDVSIGGDLRLGGALSTWGSGPTVGGATLTNQSIASPAAPFFDIPKSLTEDNFQWAEYQYDPDNWVESGYTAVTRIGAECDFRNNAPARNELNEYSTPTVVDLRDCTNLDLSNVTLELNANLTLITNGHIFENFTVRSANSSKKLFNVISPDTVNDSARTCEVSQTDIVLRNFTMEERVSGFFYTPCALEFRSGNVLGSLYTGSFIASGPDVVVDFESVPIPGVVDSFSSLKAGFNSDDTSRAVPVLVFRQELGSLM